MRVVSSAVVTALIASQIAATPVLAQITTMPVPNPAPQPVTPTPLPGPVAPQPQPVLPTPQPVRPTPQPVRPTPQPQPVRPRPQILPPRPVQPQPPVYPGYGNGQYAGTIDCRSNRNRLQICRVATGNRVVLIRQLGGRCIRGANWSHTSYEIRVWNGCYGRFAYGYGSQYPTPLPQPVPERDRGPSAGAVIAGVVVAGGLIALLASAAKKKNPAATEPAAPFPPGPPASVTADLSALQSNARPTMQNCLFAASKEIGVTGGSKIRLDKITKVEAGNGGWRFNAELTSTYPDGEKSTPIYCRATPTKIIQLDFVG